MKEPRNHPVTVRLTESEYQRLRAACRADRSSISAIVRNNVLEWVDAASNRPKVDARLGEISEKLGRLVGMLNQSGKQRN